MKGDSVQRTASSFTNHASLITSHACYLLRDKKMTTWLPIEQETQLVERARGGDQAALGELVEPLRRPLFSYIYRMVTHPQDSEDLLQDVLVRVMDSLPSYKADSRFKTWLFGIATHVCL